MLSASSISRPTARCWCQSACSMALMTRCLPARGLGGCPQLIMLVHVLRAPCRGSDKHSRGLMHLYHDSSTRRASESGIQDVVAWSCGGLREYMGLSPYADGCSTTAGQRCYFQTAPRDYSTRPIQLNTPREGPDSNTRIARLLKQRTPVRGSIWHGCARPHRL